MKCNRYRMKSQQLILILILFSLLLMFLPSVQANTNVTLDLKRNIGTDMGDGRIEGDWTITGMGESSIIRLALQFNGTNVSTTEGNALTFRFNTRDYEIGMMNITLIGWDISGNKYQDTKLREFLDPKFTDALLWIILGSVGGIFGLIVIIAIIKSVRQRKPQPLPQKDDIKIDEI